MIDYRETDLAKTLRFQLASIPTNISYAHDYECLVFRLLYFALSDNGKFYNDLFLNSDNKNKIDVSKFPQTWEQVLKNDPNDIENKYFFKKQPLNNSKSHVGRICAIEIPKGQPVYNCYDCGVDPTCCLCDNCFNKEEHSDHNVSMHISSGNAICDCGDESSWKTDPNCLANKNSKIGNENLPSNLSTELQNNIKIIIRTVFDYILDVNATNIQVLPHINKNLSDLNNIDNFKYLSDLSSLSKDYYGTEDTNSSKFCLVIWNDEYHNFDQAFVLLASASKIYPSDLQELYEEIDLNNKNVWDSDQPRETRLAEFIDSKGFAVFSCSTDYDRLLNEFNEIYDHSKFENFTSTIISERDWIKLSVCRYLFNWVETISHNGNIAFSEFFKTEISNALLEVTNINYDELPELLKFKQNRSGLLSKDFKIPVFKGFNLLDDEADTKKNGIYQIDQISMQNFKNPNNEFISSEKCDYLEKSTRLQYLFFMEMRFPKCIRIILKNAIIPLLTNTNHSRLNFSRQIMTILPILEYQNSQMDREWELSLLESFRLQVYHDPNIGTILLKEGYLLENTLSSALAVLSESLDSNGKYFIKDPSTWNWSYGRKIRSNTIVITSFKTLMSFIHPSTVEVFSKSFLLKVLILFEIFNNTYQIYRKLGDHVLFQNDKLLNHYHELACEIYEIAQDLGQLAYSFELINNDIESSIIIIDSYLKRLPRNYKLENENGITNGTKTRIVSHDITTDGATMIHPTNALLSELCRGYRFFEIDGLKETIDSIDLIKNEIIFNSDENKVFTNLGVADDVVQCFALEAQITSNFWVRNGQQVQLQVYYNNVGFCRDDGIYLMQLAIILDELPLEDIIDRYMFLKVFKGLEDFNSTIYEERSSNVLLELISLFYFILTYRLPFDSNLTYKRLDFMKTRAVMVATICKEPKTFSSIKSLFGRYERFEDVMEEIVDYLPPSTINDYGHYKLKDCYYNTLDPFDFLNNAVASETVEESFIENIAKIKNKTVDEIVLPPRFYNLKSEKDRKIFKKILIYMKTLKFVKFLYKILRFSIDTDIDNHLNWALQLIHAILIDDLDDGNFEHFVNIPICNLLLSIAEKKDLPKLVTKKASTILEILLLKDDNVMNSLLECFGEKHIEDYKKSKNGKNLETKLERNKRLALKRQKKVMAKMMKQQKEFADKNKQFFDKTNLNKNNNNNGQVGNENDIHNVNNNHKEEVRNCILCKNPDNYEELFGIPGLISVSSIFWNIPTTNDNPPGLMVEEFRQLQLSFDENMEKSSCTREKPVVNGCPHGMHYRCFQKMLKEKHQSHRAFLCPLCKNCCNVFIPSFKTRDFSIAPNNLNDDSKILINKVLDHIESDNCSDITTNIFEKTFIHFLSDPTSKSYQKIMSQLNKLLENDVLFNSSLPFPRGDIDDFIKNVADNYHFTFSLSLTIGSTLEMLEISSRDDDNSFIVPDITQQVLKSILQFRILLNYLPIDDEIKETKKRYYKSIIEDSNIGFLETALMLFMEGNESLEIILKISLSKWASAVIFSIVQRKKLDSKNLNIDSILKNNSKVEQNSTLFKILTSLLKTSASILLRDSPAELDPTYYDAETVSKTYRIMGSVYQNYLRQFKFLQKFLNIQDSENSEDSVMPDLDAFIKSLDNPNAFECQFYNHFTNSISETYFENKEKTPSIKSHQRDAEIVRIDYPSCVKLIQLPEKLKDLAIDSMKQNDEDKTLASTLCLHCGEWFAAKSHLKCPLSSYAGLIFSPIKNILQLEFSQFIMKTRSKWKIESPYLNKHGEPAQGLIGFGDSGTLDVMRYLNLNKVWFNQSLVIKTFRSIDNYFVLGGLHRHEVDLRSRSGLFLAGIRDPTIDHSTWNILWEDPGFQGLFYRFGERGMRGGGNLGGDRGAGNDIDDEDDVLEEDSEGSIIYEVADDADFLNDEFDQETDGGDDGIDVDIDDNDDYADDDDDEDNDFENADEMW